MSKPMHAVIVGNSAAAVGAVAGIRGVNPEAAITLFSTEPEHVYSRPLITYLLGGKVDERAMAYRPADWYRRNRVTPRLGQAIRAIHPASREVETAAGERVGYDRLLIATGGQPIVPPELGAGGLPGVFTFTTWADARAIKEYIVRHQARRAVVVGGGLIGLKSVEALVRLGIQTTVVELADRVLAITLDETGSRLVGGALAKAGVELLTRNTVTAIAGRDGRVARVTLREGGERECDLVVLAIGVRPRVELARGAGLAVDRGVVVDDCLRASDPAIFAAGDVAQARELITGKKMPIPIWPVAYRQGYVAGVNLAGGELPYEGGLVMNSVEVCGLPTISVGQTGAQGEGVEVLTTLDPEAPTYKKIVLRDHRVVGSVLVGDIERAGIITGLIKSQIKVAALQDRLLGEDFGLITLPPSYRDQVQSGRGVVTA